MPYGVEYGRFALAAASISGPVENGTLGLAPMTKATRETRLIGSSAERSNEGLGPNIGLSTWVELPKSKVWPSGLDLATNSAPMLVPPPGRLSTMTCYPHDSESFCARVRPTKSTPPPGT